MTEPINFFINGNIKLNLLKSEIDRRFSFLLGKLAHEQSVCPASQKLMNHEGTQYELKSQNTKKKRLSGGKVTPIKETVDDLSDSKNGSQDSSSKQKIQMSQNKYFGNLSSISGDIINQFSFSLNADQDHPRCSGKNTERESLENKQNKGTESLIQDKSKARVSIRRTPLANKINLRQSSSGMKRFSLDKPILEDRLIVGEDLMIRLKEQIDNHAQKSRRETTDDNVRTNLLRRIEAMSSKPKNVENQLI